MEPRVMHGERRQGGAALFMALIMLVAMSIAAVSLVRSVDTTVTIAGNLAFQQAALQASDFGVEAAAHDLDTKPRESQWKVGGTCRLTSAEPTVSNYFPTMFATASTMGSPTIGGRSYTIPGVPTLDWDKVACIEDSRIPDGYRVQYVIDRMCTGTLPIANRAESCVSDNPEEGGSRRARSPRITAASSIRYRLTVRVTGPNNAQSFVQVVLRD